MKVTVFGSGYAGLVTTACLSDVGNDVVCVDIDNKKYSCLTNLVELKAKLQGIEYYSIGR